MNMIALDTSTPVAIGFIFSLTAAVIGFLSYLKGVKDASRAEGEYRADLRGKVDRAIEMVDKYQADSVGTEKLVKELSKELTGLKMKLTNYDQLTEKVNKHHEDYIIRNHLKGK